MALFRVPSFQEPRIGDLFDEAFDCGPWVFGPGGFLSVRPSYTLPYLRAVDARPRMMKRPEFWVHPVSLPELFVEQDVTTRTEGDKVLIHAVHTFGDEESGTDKVETNRKVDLPDSVLGDSIETVFSRGKLYLKGKWKRTEEEEKSLAEKARADALAEARKKPMELEFNMSGITPDNVSVKLVGNRLIVRGEEKDDKEGHFTSQELCRVITVPEHIDVDKLKSSISGEGRLRITAPALEKLPVTHKEVDVTVEKEEALEKMES